MSKNNYYSKDFSIVDSPRVLIITGPTASGKTQLSEMITSSIQCEIINADIGQFYQQLSIGTAKPDLKNVKYKHHLFDLLDKPEDLSVVKYRELVIALTKDIVSRGNIPVIVGGSLFYIKSLFFPPKELALASQALDNHEQNKINIENLNNKQLWDLLQKVDPERASVLHPNDIYRIKRALNIWLKTGVKPSTYKPVIDAAFNALIVYVQPELAVLKERICLRTVQMIQPDNGIHGWIEETEGLMGTEWEEFSKNKNLIGYTEIFDWIKAGKHKSELPELINKIQIKTVQYSKRQRTFWKSFEREIISATKSNFLNQPMTAKTLSIQKESFQAISVGLPNDQILKQVLTAWRNFSNN